MTTKPERTYGVVAFILRWGSYVSAAIMVLGILLVFLNGDVPIQVGPPVSLRALPAQLALANPYAIMQLGVLLLLLTPLARIVAAALSFWLEGERRYSLVSLAVLVIILASLLLARAGR